MQTEHMPLVPAKSAPRHFATIALVGAIHIAAIYALLASVSTGIRISTPEGPISIKIFEPKPLPTPPIQPTSAIPRHIPDIDVIPPVIDVRSNEAKDVVTTVLVRPQSGPNAERAAAATTPARAIADTHTIPPYPPLAVRLGQQGNVRLVLTIDENGMVSEAQVVKSSGYDALDAAAVVWVKGHWRYQPAMRNGEPVRTSMDAILTFRLAGRQG